RQKSHLRLTNPYDRHHPNSWSGALPCFHFSGTARWWPYAVANLDRTASLLGQLGRRGPHPRAIVHSCCPCSGTVSLIVCPAATAHGPAAGRTHLPAAARSCRCRARTQPASARVGGGEGGTGEGAGRQGNRALAEADRDVATNDRGAG